MRGSFNGTLINYIYYNETANLSTKRLAREIKNKKNALKGHKEVSVEY